MISLSADLYLLYKTDHKRYDGRGNKVSG
jgi:hypothetical protein